MSTFGGNFVIDPIRSDPGFANGRSIAAESGLSTCTIQGSGLAHISTKVVFVGVKTLGQPNSCMKSRLIPISELWVVSV